MILPLTVVRQLTGKKNKFRSKANIKFHIVLNPACASNVARGSVRVTAAGDVAGECRLYCGLYFRITIK